MRTVIGARGRMGRVGRAVRVLSFLLPFATAVAPTSVDAQTCGLSAGGTLSNVINSYYPGTANANAGATSISVGAIDPSGAGVIGVDDVGQSPAGGQPAGLRIH